MALPYFQLNDYFCNKTNGITKTWRSCYENGSNISYRVAESIWIRRSMRRGFGKGALAWRIHLSRMCVDRIQLHNISTSLPMLPLPSSNERDIGDNFSFDQSAFGQVVLVDLSQRLGQRRHFRAATEQAYRCHLANRSPDPSQNSDGHGASGQHLSA